MLNQLTQSIIIQGKPAHLYELWANIENFPQFMQPLKSVQKTGQQTSHWVLPGPQGNTIEWDIETTRLEKTSASPGAVKGTTAILKSAAR